MNEIIVNLKRKGAKIQWQYLLFEEPNVSGNLCMYVRFHFLEEPKLILKVLN